MRAGIPGQPAVNSHRPRSKGHDMAKEQEPEGGTGMPEEHDQQAVRESGEPRYRIPKAPHFPTGLNAAGQRIGLLEFGG